LPEENTILNTNNNIKIEDILDNADGDYAEFDADLETQKKVACDISKPIEIRLEAFEDVIDSQIGDSTLTRARNIERTTGFHQLYLKLQPAVIMVLLWRWQLQWQA
jgi:hypothetical protein